MKHFKRQSKLLLFVACLSLATGCKTAPRVETLEEGSRKMSSILTPLADLLMHAATALEKTDLLKRINALKLKEGIRRFGRVTEANIAKFDQENKEISERIVRALADSGHFGVLFAKTEVKTILKEVDAAIALRGGTRTASEAVVAGRTTGPVLGAPQSAVSESLDFINELRTRPVFKTQEGAQSLDEIARAENEVRANTNRSWFNRSNCEDLDPESVDNFRRVIDDVNDDFKRTGKMCAEKEAYLVLKFQEAFLNKRGEAAYNAILGAKKCRFFPPGLREAAERMRAANRVNGKSQVPASAPSC